MTEQMTLIETPAMAKGSATLHSCQNCGSILYVTSAGTSKRVWDAPCPACGKDMWTRMRRGQGPFQWEAS